MSMSNISRRGFIAGSALSAGLLGLAGCSASGGSASDPLAAPAADKYPIDPDGSDVKAKYASEEVRDGWTKYTNEDGGAEIGVADTARMIQVDGYAFRDMNGDGKLNLWEDWRQSAEDRAAALAEALTADEILPLLFAGAASDTSDSTGTDDNIGLIAKGSRAGVSRLAADGDSYASAIKWINSIQKECESQPNGVPYFNYSDPYVVFGLPSSHALSTIMDKDVWRKAGMWQARAWRASGVRCDLGPQVDVYSSPIGTRLSGSVSEDPALNRDFTAAFGGGMQSTWGDDEATDDQGWGKQSCAVMLKHYVGEGCSEGGRDDHLDTGKWNVFPGSNFNAHLVPFLDGGMHLDSKTEQAAAMMPCYGIAYDPNDDSLGEHVGSGYSGHNISILRNAGYDGMLVTDWLIVDGIPNGVRELSSEERYAKLLKNTISQHGGSFQPDDLGKPAYELLVKELGEDEALGVLRENARRIFKPMVNVQLFDQPYSETAVAKEIFTNEDAAAFGLEASEKSIVMVKNSGNTISKDGVAGKIYIPTKYSAAQAGTFGTTPASATQSFGSDLKLDWDIVTDTIGEGSGPAGEDGVATLLESDIARLSADDLKDVKYAVVGISSPDDAYQGVENGPNFMTTFIPGKGDEPYTGAVYRPISLQYRPFTADKDYVRKESLNPADDRGDLENRSVYGQSTYATNESDLDLVIDVKSKLPADAKLICVVDFDRPMVFSELEPYCDVILLNYGVTEQAVANIISGKAEPYGLLSFQMPKDMQTVFEQQEDVPRDMDCYTDADGNTYDFCFGLNWSGVIDDDRVKTYKATPLTKPETCEVKADA